MILIVTLLLLHLLLYLLEDVLLLEAAVLCRLLVLYKCLVTVKSSIYLRLKALEDVVVVVVAKLYAVTDVSLLVHIDEARCDFGVLLRWRFVYAVIFLLLDDQAVEPTLRMLRGTRPRLLECRYRFLQDRILCYRLRELVVAFGTDLLYLIL